MRVYSSPLTTLQYLSMHFLFFFHTSFLLFYLPPIAVVFIPHFCALYTVCIFLILKLAVVFLFVLRAGGTSEAKVLVKP